MDIIPPEQLEGDHEEVDVAEDKGVLGRVAVLLFEKGDGVVAPVAARVEVVGGVVAIVITKSVALFCLLIHQ